MKSHVIYIIIETVQLKVHEQNEYVIRRRVVVVYVAATSDRMVGLAARRVMAHSSRGSSGDRCS